MDSSSPFSKGDHLAVVLLNTIRLYGQTVLSGLRIAPRHTIGFGTLPFRKYGAVERSPVSVQFFNASSLQTKPTIRSA